MGLHHRDSKSRTYEIRLRTQGSDVRARLPHGMKEELEKFWNFKKHPETARTYPSPHNFKIDKHFDSFSEFLEFILLCILEVGGDDSFAWTLFKYQLNPNFEKRRM